MKRSKPVINQTPIKKWQQMSPMEDELAIVESDLSEPEPFELFHSLVGLSPHNYSQISQESPAVLSNEEDELQPFSGLEAEDSVEQQSYKTVNELKVQRKSQEVKLSFKQVDTNRKGCNCRNSKCQKNYCDCLRMGLVCGEGICSCQNCNNKQQKKIHRQNNKKQITQAVFKGCHCKKSHCMKKYCECHNGGRKCSPLCQCVECSNRDENVPPRQVLRKLRHFDQELIY